MAIKAAAAGDALRVIATTLQRYHVLQPEGYSVLQRLTQELRRQKDATSWTLEVDRGNPILFTRTMDERSRWVIPRIVAKGIGVAQGDETLLPFTALDIALEVDDDLSAPLSRWHLDLANKVNGVHQSGPMTHLQFGGHLHANRQADHPLKVPRWCHPPMEIGLLCEVVAANFYEEAWLDLRQEPSWCQAISLCQKLCYTHYFGKMKAYLSISSSTVLTAMWASTYG